MDISPASAAVLTMMSKVVAESSITNGRPGAGVRKDQLLAWAILDALREAGEQGLDIGKLVRELHAEDQK